MGKPDGVPVEEGQELDVTIDATGRKGDGITHVEGYTIIVPESKLGQKVRIRIERALPNYGFGKIIT